MQNSFEHPVYSKNVIEFITVANEYCAFVENVYDYTGKTFFQTAQKLLPLLYLKASLLPHLESENESNNEKFVTEQDWNNIYYSLLKKSGSQDNYPEVFDNRYKDSESPVSASIAEDLADIYQDLKDCSMLYRTGYDIVMNEAICECLLNFEEYWGQKLVNSLRAIHSVCYSDEALNNEDLDTEKKNEPPLNTDSWIISKRQNEYNDELN
jgi:hypothetical protein